MVAWKAIARAAQLVESTVALKAAWMELQTVVRTAVPWVDDLVCRLAEHWAGAWAVEWELWKAARLVAYLVAWWAVVLEYASVVQWVAPMAHGLAVWRAAWRAVQLAAWTAA